LVKNKPLDVNGKIKKNLSKRYSPLKKEAIRKISRSVKKRTGSS
jgi:hypothetical protein